MSRSEMAYRDEPAYALAEIRALLPPEHPLHRLAGLAAHLAEHPAIRAVAWEGYAHRREHLIDLIVLADPGADQRGLEENLWRFGAHAAQTTGARFRKAAPRLVARAGEGRPAYTLYFYWAEG